jgi:sulfoxide reductase heme-binding subunit YedZ
MASLLKSKWSKVIVFLLSLVPTGLLIAKAINGRLGANPIERITHETGDWILIFLVLTLAITPARKLTGLSDLIRFRKMLGLFAFYYGMLHFSTYMVLDKFFDFHDIWTDIAKRLYITVGFTALVLMIPLAITSTTGMIRRLGGKRWQQLHRLVYITAILGVIHYYWLVKSNITKPVFYGSLFAILLGYRLIVKLKDKHKKARAQSRELATSAP